MTSVTAYAGGSASQVLEAQRLSSLERIVVSAGLPMGPPGSVGPAGPTGPTGPSTRWTVEALLPPGSAPPLEPPTRPDGSVDRVFDPGEVWFDPVSGDLWVYQLAGTSPPALQWVLEGNIFGPTGPTGPTGPRPTFSVAQPVVIGTHTQAGVEVVPVVGQLGSWEFSFTVPMGATGPTGPALTAVVGEVVSGGPDDPADAWVTQSGENLAFGFMLRQGPTGPAGIPGTNIKLVGSLTHPGPPSPGEVGPLGDGHAWVGTEGNVWVWSEVSNSWVDAGAVTGPTGPGATADVKDLTLSGTGSGTKTATFTNTSGNLFPSVRVLVESAPNNNIFTDAVGVQVFYLPGDQVQVVVDDSFVPDVVKVVVL